MNDRADYSSMDRESRTAANVQLEQIAIGFVAGTISVALWWATMASAPRYSYGIHQDMGNAAVFPVLLALAILGGLVLPKHATLIGGILIAPALVLAPFTAPRGDNDGLWILIVPGLAIWMGVCVGCARAAAWTRSKLQEWRRWRGWTPDQPL